MLAKIGWITIENVYKLPKDLYFFAVETFQVSKIWKVWDEEVVMEGFVPSDILG
jgi:hypothetical protein